MTTLIGSTLWDLFEPEVEEHVYEPHYSTSFIITAASPEGLYGIITIGLKSLVAGFYFYRYRRMLPLIVAHGVYDGLQFAYFISQFQR